MSESKFVRSLLILVLMIPMAFCALHAHNGKVETATPDTISRNTLGYENGSKYRTKMTYSAYPVKVEVKGHSVCVKSNYNQVLPVYNGNGVFYSVFQLSSGVNWISGLKRGTYYINNKKITIY